MRRRFSYTFGSYYHYQSACAVPQWCNYSNHHTSKCVTRMRQEKLWAFKKNVAMPLVLKVVLLHKSAAQSKRTLKTLQGSYKWVLRGKCVVISKSTYCGGVTAHYPCSSVGGREGCPRNYSSHFQTCMPAMRITGPTTPTTSNMPAQN